MEDQIIVNITTWTKRDKFLRIVLEHFQKQTLKPNHIILWLSIDEYPTIPSHIQKLKSDGLINAIKTTKRNIYCHKRWCALRSFPNAYNIMIDDDIFYPEDFIQTLYSLAKKHNCVSCYWTEEVEYSGITLGKRGFTPNVPSHYNRLLSGLTCIPPNLIKQDEFFRYNKLRDLYVEKCDDSWVKAWLLYFNIKIVGAHEWEGKVPCTVPDTQDFALWRNWNCKKASNGVQRKINNFATSIDILQNIYHKNLIDKLWPEFDIKKCSIYKK